MTLKQFLKKEFGWIGFLIRILIVAIAFFYVVYITNTWKENKIMITIILILILSPIILLWYKRSKKKK